MSQVICTSSSPRRPWKRESFLVWGSALLLFGLFSACDDEQSSTPPTPTYYDVGPGGGGVGGLLQIALGRQEGGGEVGLHPGLQVHPPPEQGEMGQAEELMEESTMSGSM